MGKIFGSKYITTHICNMSGLELKSLREKHNITQIDLAKAINTTQAQISRWENGVHTISSAYLTLLKMFFDKL
jgi:DNA-binding transcriptional regulator YiaG